MTLEQRILSVVEEPLGLWAVQSNKRELRAIALEVRKLEDRIKQLEEELMDVKNEHAVLVADVVLDEDRAERIKQLEREVELLRLYGNKDCIAQADEVLKKEAKL